MHLSKFDINLWLAFGKSPQQVVQFCNKCFLEVERGIRHECSSSNAGTSTGYYIGKRKLLNKFVGDDIVKRLDVIDELDLELPRILESTHYILQQFLI